MKNKYKHAIEEGNEVKFLLGKEEYLYGDKDDFFSNRIHSAEATLWDVFEYGKLYGDEVMLNQLENDILKVLESEITCYELQLIIKYIQTYMRYYYEEKKINAEWIVSEKIKKRILEKYIYFKSKFQPTFDFDINNPTKNEGFFLRLIEVWLKSIKTLTKEDLLKK